MNKASSLLNQLNIQSVKKYRIDVLLAVVFVSFINHLNKILYGVPSQEEINPERPTERFSWRIALLFINVAVLVTLGLTMPSPLATLLQQSVAIITRR